MQKRIWLVVLFLVGVLVITLGATAVLAQEPVVPDNEAGEEMHQSCENGDYEAMAKWHAQHCGGDGSGGMMSDNVTGNGMMGNGAMGNGMMGGGTMGNGMMGGGTMGGGTMGNGMMGGGMMGGGMMDNW